MPDPNSSAAAHPIQLAVEAQFRSRPTLRSVTTNLLGQILREKYPPLIATVSDLRLALPREGGGWALVSLLDTAVDCLAGGSFPDVSTRYGLDAYLSSPTGNRLYYTIDGRIRDYDIEVIEGVTRELASLLFIEYQHALASYWGQDSDAGGSRWKWLAGILRGRLLDSAIRQVGGNALHLNILSTLHRYPDRATRAQHLGADKAVQAYTLETVLLRGHSRLTRQASDLLVVSGECVLLCCLSGEIKPYPNLDAFGEAWGEHIQQRFTADTIVWQRYEPDGDIFEVQAALILNQRLDDLADVQLPARSTVPALEQLFAEITNPARSFKPSDVTMATLSPIQTTLPTWLQHANAADRLTYRDYLLEEAGISRQTLGDSDFDALATLRSFASEHLNHQLCLDRTAALDGTRTCDDAAHAEGYRSEDLTLTFHVPVGTLGGGYIEPVSMSLIELALKNLSGAPKGRMTLSHRSAREIESWLTPEYILQLVQRVDVGKNFPAYLREELTRDTQKARKRQQLFAQRRPLHLKTQALEHAIKGEAGMTTRGFRCVSALLKPSPLERQVDGDSIVIRTLAFLRKPGATADVVQNMFIIEPLDTQHGPHLLYRPAYSDALLEFASREQLLAAIAQPGQLQESVLTWLAERARAVYSNGGFTEPHYVRIGKGSDFDALPTVPEPAQLAPAGDASSDEILQALTHGSLMDYLFGSETRQLVDQAEQESTSNSESRWAVIMEGLGLAFNTLLMVARGPLATVGWLIQATQSLVQDLPALESDDPTAKELAWIDLLLNVGMLLLHQGSLTAAPERPSFDEDILTRAPFKRPPAGQVVRQPLVEQGKIGLPSEPPGGGHTLLDFNQSLAGADAAARLLEKLRVYNVPWPVPAPEPVKIGVHQGLYAINRRWYASVGGLLLPVSLVQGFGEVYIIHPLKPDHPGIKLKSDGRGHWSLDERLRLVGGGPKSQISAMRKQKLEKLKALKVSHELAESNLMPLVEAENSAQKETAAAQTDYNRHLTGLKLNWNLLKVANAEQKPRLQTSYDRQLRNTRQAHTLCSVSLEHYKAKIAESVQGRREIIGTINEIKALAPQLPNDRLHIAQLFEIWASYDNLRVALAEFGLNDAMAMTGETNAEFFERAWVSLLDGDPTAYQVKINGLKRHITFEDEIIESAVLKEKILEEMAQGSAFGKSFRDDLVQNFTNPEIMQSSALKLRSLEIHKELSIDRSQTVELTGYGKFLTRQFLKIDLSLATSAFIEMNNSKGYTDAERVDVLESVLNNFAAAETTGLTLKHQNLPSVRGEYLQRFLDVVAQTRANIESELQTMIMEAEHINVQAPPTRAQHQKPVNRRVFKTRNRGTWVGDIRETAPEAPERTIEIVNPFNGEVTSRFHEHAAEGVYVEIVKITAPRPAAPARSLKAIITAGNKVLATRENIERTVQREVRQLSDPILREAKNPLDWEDMFSQEAEKLEGLADELEHAPASEEHNNTVAQWRSEAQSMRDAGKRYRISGYKEQSPTVDKLEYLIHENAVDVGLVHERTLTNAKDFLSEYAIREKNTSTDLWYAHFHYADATGPKTAYSAGHLKRAEQRGIGFKAQLIQAQNRQEIIRIWRSKISPAAALKLFFYTD